LTLEALNAVLFRQEGLRGNAESYYDPRNSYLNEVLERKTGIPISLSVLYMAVGRRVGLELAGVNLPAHFVLRTTVDGDAVFIDPFHGGCLLTRTSLRHLIARLAGQELRLSESQLAACEPALVIRRMLYNLKLIYLRDRRMQAVIPVLKRLALLSRDTPTELRDLGIACFYGERRGEAIGYLEEYLKLSPYADDADEIRLLLRSVAGTP
jgi:regulator of sirC expression with transglutaminase-like and TPR domain